MSEQALVHMQGPGQQTALHRAATVGNSAAVAALIQGGCAVDLQDKDRNTALHEVSWHGFSHCVKLLVKSGADVHIRNKAGNTALHLACQNAHAQTTRLLLLGGSTPDTKNNRGDTCLHVAARYNNLTLVKILLSSLCSVTERNQAGDTALHVAAALNHKKTVQLLLEAGIDGKIRNNAGKTALDKARDNDHKDVAHLMARAPQVHRFMRGRTIRRRRQKLTAERRTQSVTRVEILPNKDSSSVGEDTPSSDHMESRTAFKMGPRQQQKHQQYYDKTLGPISSPLCPRKSRYKEQALNENDLRKGENDVKKSLLWDDGEDSVQNGKIYQLYTLYRDKDGNVRQAQANGCHCKTLLNKLEGQLTATQEEMRLHILNIHEQVNSQLGKMDHRTRHQIKVLDILNQERAAAERKKVAHKMEHRAAQGRDEALITQAAVSHELKRWCMSQLKDTHVHVPAKAQYYKLLPSQSVEQCVLDTDLESLPLLSVMSGESSTSLATYVNILPSKSTYSAGGPEPEQMGSRTYFEMKVDRSPDDYENTTLFPLPADHTSVLLLASGDPLCQRPGVHNSPISAVMPLFGEGFSSSSSQSNVSVQGPTLSQHQEHSYDRHLMSVQRRAVLPTEGTTTLEFFFDRPTEPTFSQEMKNQHAVEVTQRFFETVSTQLERWYERKIAKVEQQTELRAQQDRKELLQKISTLEEELQRLKTNENVES
ncbi:ankyrin repeat domain-containing protein 6 isoform X2 [Cottoperca gobio]|nr:ankyrin repeat domain-containing protein 6-like isoform X2 [Cottoperca gobio]XP_029316869.1 ankyrin repeat domain-containing protein 6-like isoform X2 [Cottoperca gobio]XP_029316870.1 ankyrin repeat domain-containing protein 6-like isoform X2 [Cottoperca gobio]